MMLQLICTALLLTSGNFVQLFCPNGCKCKAYGYCYVCKTGYYMMQSGTCNNCPENCQSCSSVNKCEKCVVGYYKDQFFCRPCSTGCTQCLSVNECLQCKTGYFSNGFGCTKCTSQCKTCTFEHNCITCNDGFKLNSSSCQKCPEGYYESSNVCVPCLNNCASCLIMNECTKCKVGFFGKTCDQRCSLGCKDNVCEQNTGNCVCNENYVGNNCSLCKPLKYGLHCHLDCPKGCLMCDSDGGCLVCQSGYFGIKCNCSDDCLYNKCNRFTKQCFQCKPFFKWPCLECVDGKWGTNCEKDCPDKCLSCLLKTDCTKCKDESYFSDGKCLDCSIRCQNISCNSESGVCIFGCKQGYWGKFCNEQCPKVCSNRTCNIETGACSHSSNDSYHGYDHSFDKTCSSTCIDRQCDSITGRCTLGCELGYYGDKCNKQCSSECQNFACNREKGSCYIADKVDVMSSSLNQRFGSVLLIVSIVCLVFAVIVTVISTVKSITQRRGAVLNEGSEDYAENEYEPACRNTTDSDHMYAIPEETCGSVPLGYLENTDTLPSNNSTEDMNMYINPVYADTKTSNEYEEVV